MRLVVRSPCFGFSVLYRWFSSDWLHDISIFWCLNSTDPVAIVPCCVCCLVASLPGCPQGGRAASLEAGHGQLEGIRGQAGDAQGKRYLNDQFAFDTFRVLAVCVDIGSDFSLPSFVAGQILTHLLSCLRFHCIAL
jgi:hypothetical protein